MQTENICCLQQFQRTAFLLYKENSSDHFQLWLDWSAFPHHLQGNKVKKEVIQGILQEEEREEERKVILLWFPISSWHQFNLWQRLLSEVFSGHLSDKYKSFSQHSWVQLRVLKTVYFFKISYSVYSGKYLFPSPPPTQKKKKFLAFSPFILDGFEPAWNVQLWEIWSELGRYESTSRKINLERIKCSETGD